MSFVITCLSDSSCVSYLRYDVCSLDALFEYDVCRDRCMLGLVNCHDRCMFVFWMKCHVVCLDVC